MSKVTTEKGGLISGYTNDKTRQEPSNVALPIMLQPCGLNLKPHCQLFSLAIHEENMEHRMQTFLTWTTNGYLFEISSNKRISRWIMISSNRTSNEGFSWSRDFPRTDIAFVINGPRPPPFNDDSIFESKWRHRLVSRPPFPFEPINGFLMISSSLTLLHVPTDPTRGKTGKNQALLRGMLGANLEMDEEAREKSIWRKGRY